MMTRGKDDKMNDSGKNGMWRDGTPFQVAEWIATFLAGELTEEEERKLAEWRDRSDKNRQLYERVLSEENRRLKKEQFDSFSKESGWEGYKRKQRRARRGVSEWVRFARYAAVLLIPLCVALYFWKGRTGNTSELPVMAIQTIEPGGVKASLRLSTGDVVDLTVISGAIRADEGIVIQNEGNLLSYRETTEVDSLVYNEVFVPKSGTYKLMLSDGTLVYLNSMTRIRYPVKFLGNMRNVELEGEAYFEVTRNEEKPFIVQTSTTSIQVLGTSFDVCSYKEDDLEQVTLVQGAVKVNNNSQEYLLNPGEQLELKGTKSIVRKVNVDLYTSWKDGVYIFQNMPLDKLMLKLQRWYDIEYFFVDDSCRNYRFTGEVNMDADFWKFLMLMEKTTDVTFHVDGKNVTIYKNKQRRGTDMHPR